MQCGLCLHTLRADCNHALSGRASYFATLPPHAPCRLQPAAYDRMEAEVVFASTRSVQIATRQEARRSGAPHSLPPHAPCRLQHDNADPRLAAEFFASTRSVQIATDRAEGIVARRRLCLHTLRADCNAAQPKPQPKPVQPFASTRSVQIATHLTEKKEESAILCLHTLRADCNAAADRMRSMIGSFASTRSVQIATGRKLVVQARLILCLHTLRADCNYSRTASPPLWQPFASTRSVQIATLFGLPSRSGWRFASTRSVQIATHQQGERPKIYAPLPPHAPCRLQLLVRLGVMDALQLCLHTLRADCNSCSPPCSYRMRLCLHTLRADCNRKGQEND